MEEDWKCHKCGSVGEQFFDYNGECLYCEEYDEEE